MCFAIRPGTPNAVAQQVRWNHLSGQFTPVNPTVLTPNRVSDNRIAVVGCTLGLAPGSAVTTTKLPFDVWNADEIKFSGMSECVTDLEEFSLADADTAGGSFLTYPSLGTSAARYRVAAVTSLSCGGSTRMGIVGVKKATITFDYAPRRYGTNLRGSGASQGLMEW